VEEAIKGTGTSERDTSIQRILGIEVDAIVILAEKALTLEEILKLKEGAIIEFEKPISEPLDLVINNRKIARGVTIKIGEKFGLQITEIRTPEETVQALGTKG
jgi:flagellar motor switch protein FliN/FliY